MHLFLLTMLCLMAATAAAQCEFAKIVAVDGAALDRFGGALALSNDRLAVGARRDDDLGAESGSVYIFQRIGLNWRLEAKLVAPGGRPGAEFGSSIAIDGTLLAVGAPSDPTAGSGAGIVHLFQLQGLVWTPIVSLTANDAGEGDGFGTSVALDSGMLLVGAPGSDRVGPDSGAAYLFENQGGSWVAHTVLNHTEAGTADAFGWDVDLSGNTAVIGSYLHASNGTGSGAAYVYRRDAGVWRPDEMLTATDGTTGDHFGFAVTVEGSDLVVGSPLADGSGIDAGAIYAFRRGSEGWGESMRLIPLAVAAGDGLGTSLDLSKGLLTAGAPGCDLGILGGGAAWAFSNHGGRWAETGLFKGLDIAAGDGEGIAIATDGDVVILGSEADSDLGSFAGSLYSFSDSSTLCPTLSGNVSALSLSAGGTQNLDFFGGPSLSGLSYWVAGTAAGTSFGIPVGPAFIPLNVDGYFKLAIVSPNQIPYASTTGVLDGVGACRAQITFRPASAPNLVGLTLHHALVAFDPQTATVGHVSNPVSLDLVN